jgi:hypothetical protein
MLTDVLTCIVYIDRCVDRCADIYYICWQMWDYIYVNTSVNIVRAVKGGCLWYTFSTNVKCCFPSKCYCESQFLDFNGGSPLFHISQNKVANYPRFIRFCVKERSCFPHVILSHPHHWIWILWWRWKVLTEMLTTKQSINQIDKY